MQLPTEMFENSRELSVPLQLFPTKKPEKMENASQRTKSA